jgi:hypothetical protein
VTHADRDPFFFCAGSEKRTTMPPFRCLREVQRIVIRTQQLGTVSGAPMCAATQQWNIRPAQSKTANGAPPEAVIVLARSSRILVPAPP